VVEPEQKVQASWVEITIWFGEFTDTNYSSQITISCDIRPYVNRRAILVSCLTEEADQIRKRARLDRRTVSGYILVILMKSVAYQEDLSSKLQVPSQFDSMGNLLWKPPRLPRGPRTTILLRCSAEENKRIRLAAARRVMTVSGFIRQCLRRWWQAADRVKSC
jgi:hypothetical protein